MIDAFEEIEMREEMSNESLRQRHGRHGGAYDRGGADSYYGRNFQPHYYKGGTYNSERVEMENMTEEEIAAYRAGYEDNNASGSFKDWG